MSSPKILDDTPCPKRGSRSRLQALSRIPRIMKSRRWAEALDTIVEESPTQLTATCGLKRKASSVEDRRTPPTKKRLQRSQRETRLPQNIVSSTANEAEAEGGAVFASQEVFQPFWNNLTLALGDAQRLPNGWTDTDEQNLEQAIERYKDTVRLIAYTDRERINPDVLNTRLSDIGVAGIPVVTRKHDAMSQEDSSEEDDEDSAASHGDEPLEEDDEEQDDQRDEKPRHAADYQDQSSEEEEEEDNEDPLMAAYRYRYEHRECDDEKDGGLPTVPFDEAFVEEDDEEDAEEDLDEVSSKRPDIFLAQNKMNTSGAGSRNASKSIPSGYHRNGRPSNYDPYSDIVDLGPPPPPSRPANDNKRSSYPGTKIYASGSPPPRGPRIPRPASLSQYEEDPRELATFARKQQRKQETRERNERLENVRLAMKQGERTAREEFRESANQLRRDMRKARSASQRR